jgi:ribonuclease HI
VAAQAKHYVVWKGRRTGIFGTWAECEAQVKGFRDAEYKAFDSRRAAEAAFRKRYTDFKGRPASAQKWLFAPVKPALPSVAVDAACDGAPGRLEYRGVKTESGEPIFRAGPFPDGTNNVGEFLAIARALDYLARHNLDWPIYSDSENAIAWVKAGKCNTKLKRLPSNTMLFELIGRAERSLKASGKRARVLKWDTQAWGENPADFGRK